jgi:hypothetical protein
MPEETVAQAWAETGSVDLCAGAIRRDPTAMHWRLYSFRLVDSAPPNLSPRAGHPEMNGSGAVLVEESKQPVA